MAKLWKTAPAFLIALALVLAVACGGGGNEDAASNANDGPGRDGPAAVNRDGSAGGSSEPLVANVSEALGASVETFEEEIDSLQMEFTMQVDSTDFSMGADGNFAFKGEDEFWMKLAVEGTGEEFEDLGDFGQFEVLALDDTFYVNIPFFGGWFMVTADEVGEEFGDFGDAFDGDAPFDYGDLVDAFGDAVEDLGVETLDGGEFRHIRVTVDAESVYGATTGALSDADSLGFEEFEDVSGGLVMDLWVHPDSFLPHLIEASGEFTADGESCAMMMSVKFFDYNEDFDMPEPPADAKSIEELFGGLFEGLEDFELETPAP